MKRGKRPVPRNLKIVRGNPGKRPLGAREPQPEVEIPEPPDFLGKIAKEHFTATAKQLAALGIMTRLDRDALAMYAQAFATWRNAVLEMAKTGPVMTGKAGNLVKHPHFRIADTAYNQMRQMLAEFGMTPSSRTRISADGGDGEGWDDL